MSCLQPFQQPPSHPCTEYPSCSLPCLKKPALLVTCESPTEDDQYSRSCMCNGSFDQTDRLRSKNFLDRLFKCVGSECTGLGDQLEFLRVLKEGCARDGYILGDDVAPRGFGGLGVSSSIVSSSALKPTSQTDGSSTPKVSMSGISTTPSLVISTTRSDQNLATTQTRSISTNSNTNSTPSASPNNYSSDLSNGALAGISVAAALVGILIAGVAAMITWKQYTFMKKHREERLAQETREQTVVQVDTTDSGANSGR